MNLKKMVKITAVAALCSAATLTMADGNEVPVYSGGDDVPDLSEIALPKFERYGVLLKNMDTVKSALDGGAVVNAAVDLTQCDRQGGGEPSQTKGGLRVSPYRIKADGSVSFSDSHFTVSTRSGSPTPIMQFLRYSATAEGAITLTSYIYSIPDYSLISESAFDCEINKGITFHAAY